MIMTHAELTDSQKALLTNNEPILLTPFCNVAPGTRGGDVMFLERIGKLRRVRTHAGQSRDADFDEFERT